jgi:putative transposase
LGDPGSDRSVYRYLKTLPTALSNRAVKPSASAVGIQGAFILGRLGKGYSRFRFLGVGKEDFRMSLIKRAYQYRFYPTAEQRQTLARTFGCCRWVYHHALAHKTAAYREARQRLSYGDLSALLPLWKTQEETAWLGVVSSVPLQQSLRHLDRAFLNFFEGRGTFPKFKRKHGPQAATYTASAFTWKERQLTLAKIPTPLAIRWSRPLPEGATPTTVTVSRDSAGRYFVSLLVEEALAPLPATSAMVGGDLGLDSRGHPFNRGKTGNQRFFQQDEKRLARLQRRHARKRKGSKNREKARRKVAKRYARIAESRHDFQHKLTTRLIRENQTICVESLAVKQMVQHPTLSKAIADVGWGELLRQLDYKAAWYGRTLVKIDRWYPSSKTCSACGFVLETLDLDERTWTCPQCGGHHDRDINAAQSILAEGLRQSAAGLAVAAWGGGVRPNPNGTGAATNEPGTPAGDKTQAQETRVFKVFNDIDFLLM